MPTGTIKIGGREYGSSLNNSPTNALDLNNVPVKVVGNSVIFMRDVAHVRDGWMVQQNVVRANGKPSVLLPIYRSGSVSTLSIINQIKNNILPAVKAAAPKGMTITGPVRPVRLRPRVDQRSVARGHHRFVPDGADDPGLPGQLAQHA